MVGLLKQETVKDRRETRLLHEKTMWEPRPAAITRFILDYVGAASRGDYRASKGQDTFS